MDLPAAFRAELERFPPPLRALLAAELAAGNTLTEVGGGHPAPPIGALAKLARKVTTRPRADGDGLFHRARNSSLSSGEFTDSQRVFFVVEPPDPPPPEPDMDAIRAAANGSAGPTETALREPAGVTAGSHAEATPARPRRTPPPTAPEPRTAVPTPDGATWTLHCHDAREPFAIRCALERWLLAPLPPQRDGDRLVHTARVKPTGAPGTLELLYLGAIGRKHAYTLRYTVAWTHLPADQHEYHRRSNGSWFGLWTRDLDAAAPPRPEELDAVRTRATSEAALHAEDHLDTAAAFGDAITAAMRDGATFVTSHKEGGTTLSWRGGHFWSEEYGESTDRQQFPDAATFLAYLRRFYHWQVAAHSHPTPPDELTAWRLILRLLRRD